MSNRILLISNHLSEKNKPKGDYQYLKDPITFLRLEDFIPIALNLRRKSLRQFLERDIQPSIPHLYDKVDFPLSILPKLKHMLGVPDGKYGCRKIEVLETYINIFESSRVDASIGVFIGLASTVLHAIHSTGSEVQKSEYLSKIANLEMLVSWAYSEPETGSYSSSLQCKAELTPSCFILNGVKRWVGNANFPYVLIWARNIQTSKIEGFLIETQTEGVKLEVMKGKFNARLTQNGILRLENAKVPISSKLAFSDDEGKLAQLFINVRAGMAMAPTGLICGVFQHTVKSMNDKVRFGAPLTSYQMIQEKLVKILAIFNNSFLLSWRLIQLQATGEVNMGNSALVRSVVTAIGKDSVRIAREMMGSNGISLDNFVMKALVDMESYFNLETTHNVSVLIAGREITGMPAFKSSFTGK